MRKRIIYTICLLLSGLVALPVMAQQGTNAQPPKVESEVKTTSTTDIMESGTRKTQIDQLELNSQLKAQFERLNSLRRQMEGQDRQIQKMISDTHQMVIDNAKKLRNSLYACRADPHCPREIAEELETSLDATIENCRNQGIECGD